MGIQAVSFADKVLAWHRQFGRHHLPWQHQDGYRVWLSEIMLQQTQVGTVIPYYENFLEYFPSIEALAAANIDSVLQHWQGLGYYARARNLHKAAQIMRDQHGGQFPETMIEAQALPGVGRSTAAAILSFVYAQSWPILDGNVKRVLARCFQVEGWYGKSDTMKRLWQLSESVTPSRQTANFNQAMMDIGSMICLKSKPKCESCPLIDACASYRDNSQAQYPAKKPKKGKPHKSTLMLLHRCQGQVLLYRRPASGIWGGLWSLPEVEDVDQIDRWQLGYLSDTQAPAGIEENLLRHQFTHYSLDISLAVIELERLPDRIADGDNHAWVRIAELTEYGLPTPVKKILSRFEN
jgi:A/G-specific adenine glycosylase